jgi:hypothetical protein
MTIPKTLALSVALALPAAAEPLSRAQAVAFALERNPDVKKSVEDMARLRGLITEARADALPDVTLLASSNRYRDPSLLNSSSFDAFPPESLPLSLFGVVGLLGTRDTLNIMSMIGLIMLMGLVTKNAILLVDFANQARARGVERDA